MIKKEETRGETRKERRESEKGGKKREKTKEIKREKEGERQRQKRTERERTHHVTRKVLVPRPTTERPRRGEGLWSGALKMERETRAAREVEGESKRSRAEEEEMKSLSPVKSLCPSWEEGHRKKGGSPWRMTGRKEPGSCWRQNREGEEEEKKGKEEEERDKRTLEDKEARARHGPEERKEQQKKKKEKKTKKKEKKEKKKKKRKKRKATAVRPRGLGPDPLNQWARFHGRSGAPCPTAPLPFSWRLPCWAASAAKPRRVIEQPRRAAERAREDDALPCSVSSLSCLACLREKKKRKWKKKKKKRRRRRKKVKKPILWWLWSPRNHSAPNWDGDHTPITRPSNSAQQIETLWWSNSCRATSWSL